MMSADPKRRMIWIELALILLGCVVVFLLAAYLEMMETMHDFMRAHEGWQLDEITPVTVFLAMALGVFALRRWLELRRAMAEIKHLRGLLPVCSACKKIRDDVGLWHEVEVYVRNHSDAEFTHSMCPDCQKRMYGKVYG